MNGSRPSSWLLPAALALFSLAATAGQEVRQLAAQAARFDVGGIQAAPARTPRARQLVES
ncbi:hypothetical protein [Acidocella sp.]|uniref:hypothetical protein n=1 Tax=Acidocella sp. TaxID=50710 RepID=UPI002624DE40|nr:hypothetical protein [Acidocella sp.]MDD2795696.1 hypothetical protein [Acidocella sp.]